MTMTPDQLKQYVDAAFSHYDSLAIAYFVGLTIICLLGSGVVAWVRSYTSEKGKNRATKADIAEITTKLEAAKSEFSEKLERLT